MNTLELILIFLISGVLGWILDTIYRKWLGGDAKTYIPYFSVVYAIGAVTLYFFFQTLHSFLFHVIIGTIMITFLELLSGLFCVHVLHKRLWNYSQSKLNFYGHIDAIHTTYWFSLTLIARLVWEIITVIKQI